MQLGPLEFLVIGFPGNQFTGAIMTELNAIRAAGIIRVVDLVFILKDGDGNITISELGDFDGDAGSADGESTTDVVESTGSWGFLGLLTMEDLVTATIDVPNNSSAAIVLFEHRWALGLQEAVLDAGGILLAQDRVSKEALAMLLEELTLIESGMAETTMETASA